ncbi:MAG TPA: hypothetical protein VMU95_01320 [Trebonia sp.]|nr:hypothetical protein [Trebonia sp.]
MGAVAQAVRPVIPAAVGQGRSVAVATTPQLGPYEPMSGKSVVPYVPGGQADEETPWQPAYATTGAVGRTLADGSPGAPSVPADGFLYKQGPIDAHYMVESDRNPYATVGRPGTIGWWTWVKGYANHVFNGKQNVDEAGWQQSSPQQRTSFMRITGPAHGPGFAPETFTPKQLPQQPRTQQFLPATGTDQPGPRPGQGLVLNSLTYGAGQTAGGVGGNQYTPAAGPPETTSTAGTAGQPSGYPSWG